MDSDTRNSLQQIDVTDWKAVAVEYGQETLAIRVPPSCAILSRKETPTPADPRAAVEEALSHPIGCPTLETIIGSKGKGAAELRAAVTVSDITRPVPYKGDGGILRPLLNRLETAGIPRVHITIVVGNGMHRPSTRAEHSEMFGDDIVRDYRIVDHDCEDLASLTHVGKSATGGDVFVNSLFHGADLRIATGLVESHFMAGLSGG